MSGEICRNRRGRRRRFGDGVSVVRETLPQRPPDQVLVVHDEKVCGTHWYRCLLGNIPQPLRKIPR